MKGRLSEYERKDIERNAENHPDIVALDKEFNGLAKSFYDRVEDAQHDKMMSLAVDLARLPYGKPEYQEAKKEFKAKVNAALGGNAEQQHPDLGAALDYLHNTKDFMEKRNAKVSEVRSNYDELTYSESEKMYREYKSNFDQQIKEVFEIPEGLEETDPLHPSVLVPKFATELGDTLKETRADREKFLRVVLNGLPPRSKKDVAAMSPQELAAVTSKEQKVVTEARRAAPKILMRMAMSDAMLPGALKEIQRLRAKLGEDIAGAPPDPTRQKPSGDPPAGEDDDIRTFKPPSIEALDFAG
jgi:hypothetical protein